MNKNLFKDTIIAPATPEGQGAISMVRLSGGQAISICEKVFTPSTKGKKLSKQPSHTLHHGLIASGDKDIDEVLVSIFKAPHSYTMEEMVEISCHGSTLIQQQLIQLFIKKGARMANPGEFTMRAFINGRMDLAQAEGVADLVAAESASAHEVAFRQMRGGFSNEIKELRQQLVDFASLIELELDFSEEDVAFADRKKLTKLVGHILKVAKELAASFQLGNVIKNGVTTVIAGRPNAGKSTLLNTLVHDDRAIVSEIPGTTRDTIEELININGILFRLVDTAGLREATGEIEAIGVEKTMEKIAKSAVVIYLFDVHVVSSKEVLDDVKALGGKTPVILTGNKMDRGDKKKTEATFKELDQVLYISSKENQNIEELRKRLVKTVLDKAVDPGQTIVTNMRHYEALKQASKALEDVQKGLTSKVTADLLATDIRVALQHLGAITGEVTSDELLGNIFGKFCIGK